jgi:hypothetical protein
MVMRTSLLFFGAISSASLAAACNSDGDVLFDGKGTPVGVVSHEGDGNGETPAAAGSAGAGQAGSGAAVGDRAGATALEGPADSQSGCWSLPIVDRVRVLAPAGNAAAVVGGKIMGSNTSAMNGFVELAAIAAAPAEGTWVELDIRYPEAYRYVKYYAPPNTFGALAEVEFYRGAERLSGAGFGTAAAPDKGDYQSALDGNAQSRFEGALPDDNYVGLDLAAGHLATVPSFMPAPGRYASAQSVVLGAEAGSRIFYTVDGSDPREGGREYAGPIAVADGSTLLRAVAKRDCTFGSDVAQALYSVGDAASGAVSSMHIGNSLTDTIVDRLQPMAQSGGITLDFNRYTIPGAGTWLYDQSPTGGFGVDNVQSTLRTRPFDHLSLQPFPNQPCQPAASSDGPDSDAGYINQAWADAKAQNPNVQLWIYQQWPSPVNFSNCMSGGGWTRPSWEPPAPATWEDAVQNELGYQEAVRTELVRLNPNDPPPFIVPGGNALVALKQAMEAGQAPGLRNFFPEIFAENGTDLHLTDKGAYLITAVFYASLFQSPPPAGALDASSGLSSEQAALFRDIAWQTVSAYSLSGIAR